jgi:hypothetical protein
MIDLNMQRSQGIRERRVPEPEDADGSYAYSFNCGRGPTHLQSTYL